MRYHTYFILDDVSLMDEVRIAYGGSLSSMLYPAGGSAADTALRIDDNNRKDSKDENQMD